MYLTPISSNQRSFNEMSFKPKKVKMNFSSLSDQTYDPIGLPQEDGLHYVDHILRPMLQPRQGSPKSPDIREIGIH